MARPLGLESGFSCGDVPLLDHFLAATPAERDRRFASTARAASLTGLSQRTIQQWIQTGVIDAVPIGQKYQVDLWSLKTHLAVRATKDR